MKIKPRKSSMINLPKIGLEGHMTVELINKEGKVTRKLKMKNLITDAGLNALGNGSQINNVIAYAACGTGSTAPATSDTSLVAEISPAIDNRTSSNGGTTDVVGSAGTGAMASPEYWYIRKTRLFDFDQAVGNLTEIGFFTASSGGTMWCRQLFKDSGGVPTTITKTASDQLRVTYEIRMYPPQVDVTGTINISGVDYNYTIRASRIASGNPWGWDGSSRGMLHNLGRTDLAIKALETNTLGAITSTPGGTQTQANTNTVAAYVNDTFYWDLTSVWNSSTANFGTGIGALTLFNMTGSFGNDAPFQCSFSPKLPKDSTKQLTLTFRLSFGRY